MADLKGKIKVNSEGEKEIEKVQRQFDKFEEDVKELHATMMDNRKTDSKEEEPQTKLSQNQISNSKDIYLKPSKSVASKEKFNERFRDDWNFQKEYVYFIAEHREIIGEKIETWTKPFPGVPAEYWEVPTNRPVWAPRYVAEQIKKCTYQRLTMNPDMDRMFMSSNYTGNEGVGSFYGKPVVETVVQRLDAIPASKKKSIFMGDVA